MRDKQRFEVNMLEGPIVKNLLIFTLPIMVSYLFQQLYTIVDTAIVGNTLGTQALASVGSVAPVFDLLVGFAIGIGNGLAIVAARAFGAGDMQRLRRSVFGSIVIGFLTSAALTLLSVLLLAPLLRLIRVPEELYPNAYRYIMIISLFLFVTFAYNLCAGLMRAVGNSFVPLLFLILSSVLNIGLDLLFILAFGMGVAGAAAATVLAQFLSAVLCLFYIVKRERILIPKREDRIFDAELYRELAAQGFSMAFMTAIVNIGTVILQFGINSLDSAPIIAGHTAARRLFGFTSLPSFSLALGISTFVSQNKGAGQRDRIVECMKKTYVIQIALAAFMTVVMLLFSRTLIALVAGTTDPTVLKNGSLYLCVAAPNYATLGILLETRHALQGIGEKLAPLTSSVIECVMKIVFVVLLIPRFAYMAVIFCEPVIWFIMVIQLLFTFWRRL